MRHITTVHLILLIIITLSHVTPGQEVPAISIMGTITDAGGNGIEDATITVIGHRYATVTSQYGNYDMLSGSETIHSIGRRNKSALPYMSGGFLYFTVNDYNQPVLIRLPI